LRRERYPGDGDAGVWADTRVCFTIGVSQSMTGQGGAPNTTGGEHLAFCFGVPGGELLGLMHLTIMS